MNINILDQSVAERITVRIGKPCMCKTTDQDDGNQTCWIHHDCANSDCTHQDSSQDEDNDED